MGRISPSIATTARVCLLHSGYVARHPESTVSAGLGGRPSGAVQNLDNLYTRPGFAGLYGVSGVGNLFNPGVLAGSVPVFSLVPSGVGGFDAGAYRFSPLRRACIPIFDRMARCTG